MELHVVRKLHGHLSQVCMFIHMFVLNKTYGLRTLSFMIRQNQLQYKVDDVLLMWGEFNLEPLFPTKELYLIKRANLKP